MKYNYPPLDFLVCPLCKGKLEYRKERQELVCYLDRKAFLIRHGIPVMVESKARKITLKEWERGS